MVGERNVASLVAAVRPSSWQHPGAPTRRARAVAEEFFDVKRFGVSFRLLPRGVNECRPDVNHENVHFLYPGRPIGWDDDLQDSSGVVQFASAAPAQCYANHAPAFRFRNCLQDARGIPRARYADENVARRSERRHLSCEHGVISVVIRPRCQDRRISGQSHTREPHPRRFEAAHELCRQVLRIGCGPAVAADEDFPTLPKRVDEQSGGGGNRIDENQGVPFRRDGFLDAATNRVVEFM